MSSSTHRFPLKTGTAAVRSEILCAITAQNALPPCFAIHVRSDLYYASQDVHVSTTIPHFIILGRCRPSSISPPMR